MSANFSEILLNVRRHLKDLNSANYEITNERLGTIINRVGQRVAERYGRNDIWTASAITINTTNTDFNLTTTREGASIASVRLHSNQKILQRWPRHVIDQLREGTSAVNLPTGEPEAYYVTENISSLNGVSLYPKPSAADTLDVLYSYVPSFDADTPSAFWQFNDLLLAAIEYRSAAQALASMDPAALDRLKISTQVAGVWLQEAASCEKQEATRKARLTRPSHIPAQVN